VLEHTIKNNGGYLSQACSSAEILAALYALIMKLGKSAGPLMPPSFVGAPGLKNKRYLPGAVYNGPTAPELDRFFFSPVHYSLVLYAALIETGRLAENSLEKFNMDGETMEMIGAEHSPGIAATAGSLGQILSVAGGVALARKLKREAGKVWVFMSDGEFQEGQTYEALAALSYYKIDNIGVIIDANAQQCDGAMPSVMSIEPLHSRLTAFGAEVREVNGHDFSLLVKTAENPHDEKPLFIIARTDPCRGLEILRKRAPKLHYVRFKDAAEKEEYMKALALFGKDD
jgi:transketolase